MKRLLTLSLMLAACGGDDGGSSTPDAAHTADAAIDTAAAKVVAVTCPASPAATVMTTNASNSYMPMATTITSGQIVKFVMSSTHDVQPNPIAPMSDAGTVVGFGATKCLQFNATGTFGIYCSTHSFAGTITVN